MNSVRTAVVLANLGAPATPGEVRPFLKQLFNDPDIMRFPGGPVVQELMSSLIAVTRAPRSRKTYRAIGGGSPLHANTLRQAGQLQRALRPEGDYQVFVAQRYWHPFFDETAGRIEHFQPREVIVIPLYPHYSTTTTLSIINAWRRLGHALPPAVFVERFYAHPDYIEACVLRIREALDCFEEVPHILFSAHSIPLRRVTAGDPYPREVTDHAARIMEVLGKEFSWSLCYQSKVGPVSWLEPSLKKEVAKLAEEGVRRLLVVPISFVSEHLETLYELDVCGRHLAREAGMLQYERAATVQEMAPFVHMLKEIVVNINHV